ncbi:transposase [Leptolyngbya iicbica]|uniref:Transposase n=2 Tax=Cyanophyceae TaxID=3028117 RepID=A0A4Q7DZQ5_9CYAN|nr:transposase [Leptolyngbya sp. LK]RZM75037.1 transposase [Leptolyngbya sp. LK]
MPYDPKIHRRRSTRLRHYDYATPGFYFVTICAHQRQHLFGKIQDDYMILNDAGRVAQAHWQRLAQHFAHIQLDAFVVMPNHVHGIIQIVEWPDVPGVNESGRSSPTSGRGEAFSPNQFRSDAARSSENASPLRSVDGSADRPHGTPSGSVGAIVGNYKSVSALQINRLRHTPGTPVWQRNYHDRIIRHQTELDNIRVYIQTNPQNWQKDSLR